MTSIAIGLLFSTSGKVTVDAPELDSFMKTAEIFDVNSLWDVPSGMRPKSISYKRAVSDTTTTFEAIRKPPPTKVRKVTLTADFSTSAGL